MFLGKYGGSCNRFGYENYKDGPIVWKKDGRKEGRKEWLFKATASSSVDAANMGSQKHRLFYAAKVGEWG